MRAPQRRHSRQRRCSTRSSRSAARSQSGTSHPATEDWSRERKGQGWVSAGGRRRASGSYFREASRGRRRGMRAEGLVQEPGLMVIGVGAARGSDASSRRGSVLSAPRAFAQVGVRPGECGDRTREVPTETASTFAGVESLAESSRKEMQGRPCVTIHGAPGCLKGRRGSGMREHRGGKPPPHQRRPANGAASGAPRNRRGTSG